MLRYLAASCHLKFGTKNKNDVDIILQNPMNIKKSIISQLLRKDYFYSFYTNSNAAVGGALHIPAGIRRCAELLLLDTECVRARPRPHLVERGQTCGCHSPDWHTLWLKTQPALTAGRWTGQKKNTRKRNNANIQSHRNFSSKYSGYCCLNAFPTFGLLEPKNPENEFVCPISIRGAVWKISSFPGQARA